MLTVTKVKARRFWGGTTPNDSRKWQHLDQVLRSQQRELVSLRRAHLDEYLDVSLRRTRGMLYQLKLLRAELESLTEHQDQFKLELLFGGGLAIDVEREMVLTETEVDSL